MTESEAYLQLALIIGTLMCVPFLWHFFYSLGKALVNHFFPPEFITIEIKKLNGTIEVKKVKFEESEEIIDALLEGGTFR